MTNDFALNHDKSLKIYFFCVKRQAKNDFLKDVESTVVTESAYKGEGVLICRINQYHLNNYWYNLVPSQ